MADFSKFNRLLNATDLDREGLNETFANMYDSNSIDNFNKKALEGLNDGQRQMVLDIVEYLGPNSRKLPYFVVYGAGGFGKTFAIIRALMHINAKRIGAAAPSHFAKNVLQDAMGEEIKVTTIASLMGKKLIYQEGKAILIPNPRFKYKAPPIDSFTIIVVDEISMVDDVTGQEIVKACKNKRLIVMGE